MLERITIAAFREPNTGYKLVPVRWTGQAKGSSEKAAWATRVLKFRKEYK